MKSRAVIMLANYYAFSLLTIGQIIHTHSYKKPNPFQEKRVVVIGIGNSGGDAAVELSSLAQQVCLDPFMTLISIQCHESEIFRSLLTKYRSLCGTNPPRWLRQFVYQLVRRVFINYHVLTIL